MLLVQCSMFIARGRSGGSRGVSRPREGYLGEPGAENIWQRVGQVPQKRWQLLLVQDTDGQSCHESCRILEGVKLAGQTLP